jgi:hypothetical protein
MLRRRVPIWLRVVFYSCLGVTGEVIFTALCARLGIVLTADLAEPQARSGWRLKGHSFVWMLPIYGFGLLAFEGVHDVMRGAPWPVRASTYVVLLYVIEYASGALLERLTGAPVWRWVGRFAFRHVHLAMAPVWLGLGLALESLHDLLGGP